MMNPTANTESATAINAGFKQTEVGWIPVDWEVVPIGQICKIYIGRDLNENIFSTAMDNEYRYPVYSNTVSNYGLYGFYSESEYQGDSLTVVGRGVGLGTAFARTGGYGAIGRLIVLFPDKYTNAIYLSNYINFYISIFFESSGVPQLTGISFSKYKVPLPPTLAEQTAIATALSDMDALIQAQEELLAKKRAIKQGAMQELLRPKEGWVVKRLGEVADIDFDTLNNSTDINFNFNYISLEDVEHGVLTSFTEMTFGEAPSRARRKLTYGDVLLATVRPNLKSHLLFDLKKGDFVCSTGFSVLRGKSGILNHNYLFQHLFGQYINEQIETVIAGSNYPAISSKDVKSLQIPVPDYLEQTRIANILSDMDTEIEQLEAQLTKYRQLKVGMMQELLTGKKRLV